MLSIAFQAPIRRVAGTLNAKPKGVRVAKRRGLTLYNDFAGLDHRLSSLLVRGVIISFSARHGAVPESRESHLAVTARCGPDTRFIDRACRAVPAEDTPPTVPVAGRRLRGSGLGSVPVGNSKTTAIPLILPSVQAMALAQFVKRA